MVKVVSTSQQNKIKVLNRNENNIVSTTGNLAELHSKTSKSWAISDDLVEGIDYSSKYYANASKEYANQSNFYNQETQSLIDSFREVVQENKNVIDGQTTDCINYISEFTNSSYEKILELKNDGIMEMGLSKDESISEIVKTSSTEIAKFNKEIECSKKEINLLVDSIQENAEEIANRTSFAMFDTITKDHILTYEETEGLALQGTYVYKQAIAGSRYGYPDFYNKVVEEFNEATSTETVNGVTVKVHSNGHKFYDIADKNGIDGFFDSYGYAWFYGVDTENERVFLPRNNWFAIKGSVDTAPVAGNGMTLGLEGANGNNVGMFFANGGGAIGLNGANNAYGQPIGYGTSNWNLAGGSSVGITTDGANSGIIADTSNVIQTDDNKYLYICVGNTTSYEGMTEVVNQGMEILEQVNQGIESRLDVDITNLTDVGKENVIGLLLPDYTTEVIRSSSGFTSETNQWLKWESYQTGGQTAPRVIVNGVEFLRYTSGSTSIGVGGADILPISKGDVITTTGSVSLKTYSMKGAK